MTVCSGRVCFDMAAFVYWALAVFPLEFLHKLGYYLVGLMLGAPGGEIEFGVLPDRAISIRLGRLTVTFHLGLRLWLVPAACFCGGITQRSPRHRLAFSLGRPNMSLVTCLILKDPIIASWQQVLAWMRGEWQTVPFHTWALALGYWAPILFIVPLIPWVLPLQRDG